MRKFFSSLTYGLNSSETNAGSDLNVFADVSAKQILTGYLTITIGDRSILDLSNRVLATIFSLMMKQGEPTRKFISH